ncbi:glutathione S-transferase 1-1 [Episyrphus balteatus]|uniref:glutathione S-transferase 1-1 n=1 Tax=Episyrphus balteatus TaxID=286459 RepID=UPI00248631D3|nr:glutathione S-transferase 1-1 [Episyrphus balteatus]
MPMKLYGVSDGPPTLGVRMTLKALNVPYEYVNVNFNKGEHMTDSYAKMNPQKEIPVLDDNGFYLQESNAIIQYICDKYGPDSPLYPKDPTARAIVNQRLFFNMGFYYSSIGAYALAPIFFDYERSAMGLKKVENALKVFQTYLERLNTKYVAGDNLTVADFVLITSTMCLEAINFDISGYPLIKKWYEMFKKEHSELWEVAKVGMLELAEFEKNPPDLSTMNHPFHPTRKATK